jgi:hypothetical protein
MCCVLFGWLTRQPYFKEITDIDIRERLYNDKMKMLEDDILPFGFIEDGTPDETIIDTDGQLWHAAENWSLNRETW